MITRSVAQCAVAWTALTLLTGCSLFGDHELRIDRTSGPLADMRFQWSAASGIDLLSSPAVPVRAYLESWGDAQTTGSLDYAYPGFERAVGTNSTNGDHDILTQLLRPDNDRPVKEPSVGNNRYRIQSFSRSGTTVMATVCQYRYGLALENANGSFSSVASFRTYDKGINTFLVRLEAPPDESTGALPPQTGPAVAPSDDVFGDWKITGFLGDLQNSDPKFPAAWPTYERDAAGCVEAAPDPPERRAFLITGEHPRSDFPTSPPTPGWPAK